jgi:hypothetical protein
MHSPVSAIRKGRLYFQSSIVKETPLQVGAQKRILLVVYPLLSFNQAHFRSSNSLDTLAPSPSIFFTFPMEVLVVARKS